MNFVKILLCLVFALLLIKPVVAQMTGSNADAIRDYRPPDIFLPHGRTIKLEKLDINKANIQQLMALPEINEDVALKIMQKRPIKYLNELENLPYLSSSRVKLIIKGFSHLVLQKFDNENTLKQ